MSLPTQLLAFMSAARRNERIVCVLRATVVTIHTQECRLIDRNDISYIHSFIHSFISFFLSCKLKSVFNQSVIKGLLSTRPTQWEWGSMTMCVCLSVNVRLVRETAKLINIGQCRLPDAVL